MAWLLGVSWSFEVLGLGRRFEVLRSERMKLTWNVHSLRRREGRRCFLFFIGVYYLFVASCGHDAELGSWAFDWMLSTFKIMSGN